MIILEEKKKREENRFSQPLQRKRKGILATAHLLSSPLSKESYIGEKTVSLSVIWDGRELRQASCRSVTKGTIRKENLSTADF